MRILIVSQHYHPETMATGRRAQELAEDFAAAGHHVTVLAGQPSHPTSRARSLPKLPTREQPAERLELLRVPVLATDGSTNPRRMLAYATHAAATVLRGVLARRSFDAVVAISPLPTGLAAAIVAAIKRAPLVFDLQDFWPESAAIAGAVSRGTTYRAIERLEHALYARAAAITAISEGFARRLVERGVPAAKVHIIPNGVDVEFFAREEGDAALADQLGPDGAFKVVFAGNMGLMQDLDTVLDAAKLLAADDVSATKFVLVGDGVRRAHLEARVRDEAIPNVRLLPPLPRERIPDVLFLADTTLVTLIDRPLFEVTIPSKTYECMAAARPILCGVRGETEALVARAGCGFAFPPGDPAALARAVRLMRSADREAMGANGRAWVEANATRAMVAEEFLAVLRSVTR